MGTATPKAFKDLSILLRTHFDDGQVHVSSTTTTRSSATNGDCPPTNGSSTKTTTAQQQQQYLHVHQKLQRTHDGETSHSLSLTYLPTFHIIGTLDDKGENLALKLMTFHGKVVTSVGGTDTPLSVQETLDFFKLLDDAHLCSGIRKLPAHSFRIRNDKYLMEQFQDTVVFRARDCKFAVYGGAPYGATSCDACQGAQNHLEETDFRETEADEDHCAMPMEKSYHSIFGSEKNVDASFENLLQQYSPLVPAYYAAVACANAGNKSRVNGGKIGIGGNNHEMNNVEESIVEMEGDDIMDDDVIGGVNDVINNQPSSGITLQPIHKLMASSNNLAASQQPQTASSSDETFQKTMLEIARLGLKSDPFVCSECEATFKTYFGLRKHVTTSGHESEYHPRCFICHKFFKRAVNLRMHYTSTHLNLRPYKCSQCDFTSATSSSIILHSKSAHNIAAENIMTIDSEIRKLEEFEKRFGIICMQNRKRKSLKTIHIPEEEIGMTSSNENHIENSDVISKPFNNHLVTSLAEDISETAAIEPEVSISAMMTSLAEGGGHHMTSLAGGHHMTSLAEGHHVTSLAEGGHHMTSQEGNEGDDIDVSDLDPDKVNSDPFVCEVCDVTAPNLLQMKKHVELSGHETKYFPRCFICLKSFKRLSNLRFHHSSTHLKLRPYKCCHCDYIGTAPSAVINHAKSLHNAQDDEYITIESEMTKLEAFESKFGIIAMQKRKRKHDKTIPEMPLSAAKLDRKTINETPLTQPTLPKLTPAPGVTRQQSPLVVTAPMEDPMAELPEPTEATQPNPLLGYFNNVIFQEYLSNLKRMQNVSLTVLQKALINNASSAHEATNAPVAEDAYKPSPTPPSLPYAAPAQYAPRGGAYTPRRHNQVDFDVDSCDAQNMNSDPFQCDECNETFNKPHLLRSHIEQTAHKTRTDAKCFVCQKRCSRLSNLRSHYSAVHFNLKPYKCSLCEVTASNSSTILTHAKDVHNLETNRFITLESEILKLEEYERKFGIVCMQKRKRRTMQPVD